MRPEISMTVAFAMGLMMLAACARAPSETGDKANENAAQRVDDTDSNLPAFRAVGQEPGWLLTIAPGRVMEFRYNFNEERIATPVPVAVVADGVTVYHAQTEANDLRVEIDHSGCSDVMSGRPFPATVRVVAGGVTYSGCGEPVKPTVLPGEYCFRDDTTGDVLELHVEIKGAWAHGRYNWLPTEKDARTGIFQGLLDGNTVVAHYEFTQEGQQDHATITVVLEPVQVRVVGGPPSLGLAATIAATDC